MSTLCLDRLFQEAQKVIPGGVNSPVRNFSNIGRAPLFFESGQGAYITDVNNKSYIDYVLSWGPLILGHQNPDVIADIHKAVDKALSFGAPTQIETTLAKTVCSLMPSIEKIRMLSSGTEATMTAIRLARSFTGRDIIIKFEGGYHGHSDALLVKAGSGALTFGRPSSDGIPVCVTQNTINIPYNDIDALQKVFEQYPTQIAGVIVEPIAANMGCVLPNPSFLSTIRALCDTYQSVCIFDEVITGFRVALGGAQSLYGIKADLTTLGKIIGGGMPVGAVGGRQDIMDHLAPLGGVYQAGTLSGNPITMQAGLSTVTKLSQPAFYTQLQTQTEKLVRGIKAQAQKHSIPLCVNSAPGLFGFFFSDQAQVQSFKDVMKCSQEQFKIFYHLMLEEGLYFAPSAFESAFISIEHTDAIIEKTLEAFDSTFKKMSQQTNLF